MNTYGPLDESRPLQLSSDVARRFGVVPQTVLYWVRTGRLRARRTERGIHLFDPEDVDAFAIAREMKADEP
jgi:DNA-binding transcriptional MerR regulator